MRAPPRRVAVPTALAAAGALTVAAAGVRGPDYPAHALRGELWRRSGIGVWNFTWYGGHATPTYSVIGPAVVAAVGAVAVCVVAAVAATGLAAHLIDALAADMPPPARLLAASAFAAGSVVNVVVGRVGFAAGLALLLAALVAWHGGRPAASVAIAVLVPLTSPVVAAFGAIVMAAVGADAWSRRRHALPGQAVAIVAALSTPLLVMAVQFGGVGHFPYRGNHVAFALVVFTTAAAAHRIRVVTIAAAMAGVAAVVLYAVPNPLGGNFSRFTQYFAVPVLVLGAFRARRVLAAVTAVVAVLAVAWTVDQGVAAARQWSGDPLGESSYHQPLIDELVRRNADGLPIGRVEIPFTDTHWEAHYVAPVVPYARGWERQIDLDRNPELYAELTAADYRTWLHDNAVRWVAVPDAALDEGGRAEAAVIATRPEWLDPVWSNADWQLFQVAGYTPLVAPPAELVRQDVDTIVVRTPAPGEVIVRYRYDADLTIDGGACLARAGNWIAARLPAAGVYTIAAPLSAWLPGARGTSCR